MGEQYGGEGKDLKAGGGPGLSTGASSYKGPENFTPEDKGTKNPDDLQKKESYISTTEVHEGGITK